MTKVKGYFIMEDMKMLRRMTKTDTLLNIFDEVGKSLKVSEVYAVTGIKNYNSLKALCWYIRKAPHIPDENRIDIRIRDGVCVRVN